MTDEERYQQAKIKAERRAKELFKNPTKDIEDELAKETTLGNPDNLVKPDNKEE